VVFGAGPIGLATVLAAAQKGARVMSVDPVPARRDLAKRLGAEAVIWASPAEVRQAASDWTKSDGPPVVIETSGETAVLPQAIEMVAAAGRVVIVGLSSGTAPVRPGTFPEKEIDVIGSSCATPGDFREAIRLVSANRASLATLFSHHFPLTETVQAFQYAMSRPQDAIKIVVTVLTDNTQHLITRRGTDEVTYIHTPSAKNVPVRRGHRPGGGRLQQQFEQRKRRNACQHRHQRKRRRQRRHRQHLPVRHQAGHPRDRYADRARRDRHQPAWHVVH
jgi:NAD(P)-dependent dehydrogenase (short-subunit alcohol dehydrogenase family)